MNKRLEEKLAMLAFGDMSPEEVTRLEQEVVGDREASLVLEQYRGMRSGLRAMADIPEHQLSTERLRNAVLNQGLKPKSRPQLGWLWMPTMAAALAFGFVFIRNAQNSGLDSLAGIGNGTTVAANASHIDVPGPGKNVFAFATASGQILSVDSGSHANLIQASDSYSKPRHRVDRDRVAALKQEVMEQFLNEMSVNTNPTPRGGGEMADASPREMPTETIILIDSAARDSSTGAHKATEVDRNNDVVVGG
jgi:hypothetical protein